MAKPRSPATLAAGLITAGAGLYFVVVGLGLAVASGVPAAPGLLVACAGLAFALSGIRIAAQSLGTDDAGELPPEAPALDTPEAEAPTGFRRLLAFAPLAIVFCLALLATWIAVSGDAVQFSSPFATKPVAGIALARLAFAFGAVITWAYFVALVRRNVPPMGGREAWAERPQQLARRAVARIAHASSAPRPHDRAGFKTRPARRQR